VIVETGRRAHVQIPDAGCRTFTDPIELVGRRWSAAILLAATHEAQRFGEYRSMIPGISDRLLSQRLKELEAEHLITRQVIPSTPVQVLYRLTDKGRELVEALQPLVTWGTKWSPHP
jgi:DNA-binding HxlR family transcriptional regulator